MRRALARFCVLPLAFVLVACGGSESKEAGGGADALGVALKAPSGWFRSDDGLSVAERESDLTAERAGAARVQVTRAKPSSEDLPALVGEFSGENTQVVDGPEETSVNGRKGIAITLRESQPDTDTVTQRRYIAVASKQGVAVLVVLEAPPDTFDAKLATMIKVVTWSD